MSRRIRAVSNGRLAVFLGVVALLLWAELGTAGRPAYLAAGLLGVAFVGLVFWHAALRQRRRWFRELERLNLEAIHRIRREWDELPGSSRPDSPDPDHAYALDLDVFGRASLCRLLGQPGTAAGQAVLRRWLLEPSPADQIPARQQAVAELAGLTELRQEILARGRLGATLRPGDLDRFVEWLESPGWLEQRPLLRTATIVLPAGTAVLLVLNAAGVIGFQPWALLVLFQAVLGRAFQRPVHGSFRRAAPREAVFRGYPAIFRRLAETEFRAPQLCRLRDELLAGPEPAHRAIGKLDRLTHLANARLTPMGHLPLQAFTLWDFHVLAGLERWRRQYGTHLRDWFDGLGSFEALAALGGLAHDNPDWAFPVVSAEQPALLRAQAMAHPLLPAAGRVANDVDLGPPGSFLLVTGSNMSGKSTLLRAIGLNVVLAQAGGPVCASTMSLPPADLITSMRLQDSLEEGVSFFMAALVRLKQVVQTASRPDREGRVCVYLLDEMLQGTNSAERRLAVRAIITYLLQAGALGAVTTHDLSLAEIPELRAAARAVHFTETVSAASGGGAISFDYKLRPGVATSVNALRLMRLVGLPVEPPADPPAGRAGPVG